MIWDHYLSFVLIVVCLRAPSLGPLWGVLLVAFYVVPTNQTPASHWWAVVGPITILVLAAIASDLSPITRAGPVRFGSG